MKALCKPLRCLSFFGGRKPPDQCSLDFSGCDCRLRAVGPCPWPPSRYTAVEGQHLSKAVDMDDEDEESELRCR